MLKSVEKFRTEIEGNAYYNVNTRMRLNALLTDVVDEVNAKYRPVILDDLLLEFSAALKADARYHGETYEQKRDRLINDYKRKIFALTR